MRSKVLAHLRQPSYYNPVIITMAMIIPISQRKKLRAREVRLILSDPTSPWACGCLRELVLSAQGSPPCRPTSLLSTQPLTGASFTSVPLVWNAFPYSPGLNPASSFPPLYCSHWLYFSKARFPTVIGPWSVSPAGQGQLC